MKPEKSVPIRIRPATEIDVPFIFNSWLKSYRGDNFAKGITTTIYFNEHHKVIEELLKTCTVLIAANHDNPQDIFGYVCAERIDGVFVIHFAYTKQTYRRLGVIKALFNELGHDFTTAALFTHQTKYSDRLGPGRNLVYSPYIALTKEYRNKGQKDD